MGEYVHLCSELDGTGILHARVHESLCRHDQVSYAKTKNAHSRTFRILGLPCAFLKVCTSHRWWAFRPSPRTAMKRGGNRKRRRNAMVAPTRAIWYTVIVTRVPSWKPWFRPLLLSFISKAHGQFSACGRVSIRSGRRRCPGRPGRAWAAWAAAARGSRPQRGPRRRRRRTGSPR